MKKDVTKTQRDVKNLRARIVRRVEARLAEGYPLIAQSWGRLEKEDGQVVCESYGTCLMGLCLIGERVRGDLEDYGADAARVLKARVMSIGQVISGFDHSVRAAPPADRMRSPYFALGFRLGKRYLTPEEEETV